MQIEHKFILLMEQFQRINNKISKAHNFIVYSDNNISINTGAIHLIDAIGKHSNSNMTEIAGILGITKGAVSQMVTKLSAKGLIIKSKDDLNDKDIRLSLTEYGEKVYHEHEKLHEEMYKDLQLCLNDITPSELNHISEILDKVDSHMNKYLEKYK